MCTFQLRALMSSSFIDAWQVNAFWQFIYLYINDSLCRLFRVCFFCFVWIDTRASRITCARLFLSGQFCSGQSRHFELISVWIQRLLPQTMFEMYTNADINRNLMMRECPTVYFFQAISLTIAYNSFRNVIICTSICWHYFPLIPARSWTSIPLKSKNCHPCNIAKEREGE